MTRKQNDTIERKELILLFDATCNLCNRLIQFIKKKDRKKQFKFVSLQSEKGQLLLANAGLPTDDSDTVVYIRNGFYYFRSLAILQILRDIGGIWKLFYILIIIPGTFRDLFYKIIVKNRYKFFGRQDTCEY